MQSRHNQILDGLGQFQKDTIKSGESENLTVIFIEHASLALLWNDTLIYVDPLSEYADYARMPKADIVLVTHEHYDHLDPAAIDAICKPGTVVIGSRGVAAQYPKAAAMSPGERKQATDSILIEAIAAYNTSPDKQQFHPKDREDNGYVLNLGQTRIYIAGDTEFTPEMAALKDIDAAFLPVNLPYTMTPQMAARAVESFQPRIFYPYHTTDTGAGEMEKVFSGIPSATSVRIYRMP